MSAPEAKKDEKPKDGGDKKTATQKVWHAFGVLIAAGIGIVAIVYVAGAGLPILADALNLISQGLSYLKEAVEILLRRFVSLMFAVLTAILPAVVVGYILYLGYQKAKGGKNDHH
ncbi:MAG: hypothetical protein RLZZ308_636 [Candidatus Parcubacteria bacterium]|jgi:hypothetical protein